MRGAGGTSGGLIHFFLGLFMSFSGAFMLTNQVRVGTNFFAMRFNIYGDFGISAFGVTLIPFCLGIFFLFFDGKSWVGWAFTMMSTLAIFLGIIMNLQIYMKDTSLYILGLMLVLLVGGLGLVFRSLRSYDE